MKNAAEEIRLAKIVSSLAVGPDIAILGEVSEAGLLRLNAAGLNAVVFDDAEQLAGAGFSNVVLFGLRLEELQRLWKSNPDALSSAATISIIFDPLVEGTAAKDFAFMKLTAAGYVMNARTFDHSSYLPWRGECDILLMTSKRADTSDQPPEPDWRVVEASIFRAHFTGIFVRPGDRVVQIGDVTRYLVQANSPYGTFEAINDVTSLSAQPGSADFIAVSEPMSSSAYMELAKKASKALTPGGRLAIVMEKKVANGIGGNLSMAIQAILKPFLVIEKVFTQGEIDRYFHDVTTTDNPDGDCILVIAATDPIADNGKTPFVDTIYPFPDPTENLLAFERDYSNPWLMRAFFGMSVRTENREHRLGMARHIEANQPRSSADYGAALCVRGYDIASSGSLDEKRAFTSLALDYLSVAPSSPHAFRWNVSVAFLCGTIHQGLGEFESALSMYDRVLDSPWLSFSPTLGTKAGEAAYRSGMIVYLRGDVERARGYWKRGVDAGAAILKTSINELVGDLSCPLPDPLAEITGALGHVRRCADCLRATDNRHGRPLEAQRPQLISYDRSAEIEARMSGLFIAQEKSKADLALANARIAELEGQPTLGRWSWLLRRLCG